MRRPTILTTAALLLALGLTSGAHEPRDTAISPNSHYYTFDAVPGATATVAWGINSKGAVVGSYTKDGVTHGFLRSDGVLTTIDYEGAAATIARDINDRGDIVGSYQIAGEPSVNAHGFLRDKYGRMTRADVPVHTNTIPQRITNTGVIVGCLHHADTMATMQGIVMDARDIREDGVVDAYGRTDAYASMNNGATPDGELIVGFFTDKAASRTRGYLFYGDTILPFDVPGSTFTAAPRRLWEGQHSQGIGASCGMPGVSSSNYDVTADGQRFLMVRDEDQSTFSTKIVVVLNWVEQVKALERSRANAAPAAAR